MSKARQKGTSFEVYLLDLLRDVWPDIERAALKGINDYGDFINIDGWHIEARNRKTWALPAWIRGVYAKIERKHGKHSHKTHPWAIIFKGDKRTDLFEDYAVVPLWVLVELLYALKRDHIDTKHGY